VNLPLPISAAYRSPIFEAVGIQVVVGLLSALILDDGTAARICGVAIVAFWAGVAALIARRLSSPSRVDIFLVRFGFLPVVVLAHSLVH